MWILLSRKVDHQSLGPFICNGNDVSEPGSNGMCSRAHTAVHNGKMNRTNLDRQPGSLGRWEDEIFCPQMHVSKSLILCEITWPSSHLSLDRCVSRKETSCSVSSVQISAAVWWLKRRSFFLGYVELNPQSVEGEWHTRRSWHGVDMRLCCVSLWISSCVLYLSAESIKAWCHVLCLLAAPIEATFCISACYQMSVK